MSLAPALIPQPSDTVDRNHRITGNVVPKGNKAKLEANFAAMKLVCELDAAGRKPTPEDKQILTAYTGWGWIKEAFNTVRTRKHAELQISATAPTASSWRPSLLKLLQTMVTSRPMIDANGQPLTRDQTLQIRRNSSRGLSLEQVGEGIARNRQARLSTETEQPLPRNTSASPTGLEDKD